MKEALAAWSVLAIALTPLACGAPCQGLRTVSETSHGSVMYAAASAGSGPPTTTRAVIEPGTLDVSDGDTPGAGPSAIQISGGFEDSSGMSHEFTLYVTGIASGATSVLGPDSVACVDGAALDGSSATPCTALQGMVGASTFVTQCEPQEPCSLSIIGGLTATTTLPLATLSFDLALQHMDIWGTVVCPMAVEPTQEGTPGS